MFNILTRTCIYLYKYNGLSIYFQTADILYMYIYLNGMLLFGQNFKKKCRKPNFR